MRIGVLASHAGTTAQMVMDACADGRISASVAVVISNNENAEVLRRAAACGIPTCHISGRVVTPPANVGQAVTDALRQHNVDVVLLAGYMRKVSDSTLQAFRNRIINVHPALLPNHGGQGMYGQRVHAAVIASGDRVSGATVHIVTEEYDAGPILSQLEVVVQEDDDAESLEAKVRGVERELLIDTLATLARDGFPGDRHKAEG